MTESTRRRLSCIPSLVGQPPALDLAAFPDAPVTAFLAWLDEAVAAGVPEPRAMTLSTADAHGMPDARVLILKDVDDSGWAFASTASSAKGLQLAQNPAAALSFWWQPLVRAVRVRGSVVEASAEESAADLAARSPQAQADVAVDDWRLWRVRPHAVEFWQGATDRRHTRVYFERITDGWIKSSSRD